MKAIRVLKVLSINDFYWLDGRFYHLEKDGEEVKSCYAKTQETHVKLLEVYDAEKRDRAKEIDYEKLYNSQLVIYNMGIQRYLKLLKEIKAKYSEIRERLRK